MAPYPPQELRLTGLVVQTHYIIHKQTHIRTAECSRVHGWSDPE